MFPGKEIDEALSAIEPFRASLQAFCKLTEEKLKIEAEEEHFRTRVAEQLAWLKSDALAAVARSLRHAGERLENHLKRGDIPEQEQAAVQSLIRLISHLDELDRLADVLSRQHDALRSHNHALYRQLEKEEREIHEHFMRDCRELMEKKPPGWMSSLAEACLACAGCSPESEVKPRKPQMRRKRKGKRAAEALTKRKKYRKSYRYVPSL